MTQRAQDQEPPETPLERDTHLNPPLTVHVAQIDPQRFPDLSSLQSVILKDGPQARKEAKYTVILNRHTGDFHHDVVTIKTYKKRQGEWREDVEHTVTLSGEGEDEIRKLLEFLLSARIRLAPADVSKFILIAAPAGDLDMSAVQRSLHALSATDRIDVIADILENVSHDANLLRVLVERASRDPQLFAEAAAALNIARYKQAVDQLKGFIEQGSKVREAQFQELLTENPWMFGSEYSELLDRRHWTRDEQQDFVVRRTTDGYIELIEIKTPLEGTPLFNRDPSHRSYYAGAELSKVVGQVQNYIEKLDADRNAILANDREDTAKIRAKIIIGRDGDEEQQRALRRFNGYLHRIEILTFDQLLRIAQNVLSYLESMLRPSA
jgi:Shedu protein SduA, C-terminal